MITLDFETGDVALDADGNLKLATDADAARQNVAQQLRLHLGEWFLDPFAGTPWLDVYLTASDADFARLIAARIRELPDVRDVVIDDFERTTGRAARVDFTLTTTYGTTSESV